MRAPWEIPDPCDFHTGHSADAEAHSWSPASGEGAGDGLRVALLCRQGNVLETEAGGSCNPPPPGGTCSGRPSVCITWANRLHGEFDLREAVWEKKKKLAKEGIQMGRLGSIL